jgi:hypothetical protein
VLKAAAAISRLPLISIAAAHGAVALVVTPAAVWRPPGFMTGFHARCDAVRGAAFDACFAAAMGTAGASPAALDFIRLLGNKAYLEALSRPAERLRSPTSPTRFAPTRTTCGFLVNGKPPLIDVGERQYLDFAQLGRVLAGLSRDSPKLS